MVGPHLADKKKTHKPSTATVLLI